VRLPLWREVGSVLFSFCRASPAQPFSDLSPTGLTSIVYFRYFCDSPNVDGQDKSKSHYDRQSVGQAVMVSGAHLEPATNLSWDFILDSYKFELEYFLRLTVSQPVCMGIGPPFGALDQILSCSSESESELHYNWQSVSQYVLVSSPSWDFWPEISFFFLKVTVLSLGGGGAPSDERSGLSFVSFCQYSLKLSVGIYIGNLQWYLQYLC
jgi:hypothetical protein